MQKDTQKNALDVLLQDIQHVYVGLSATLQEDMFSDERSEIEDLLAQATQQYNIEKYDVAIHNIDVLLTKIEDLELQFLRYLEQQDTQDIQARMHTHLDKVTTDPSAVVLEEIEEIRGLRRHLGYIQIPQHSWLYGILYNHLPLLEVIVIVCVVGLVSLMYIYALLDAQQLWYILTFFAVLGIGVWLLKKVMYIWLRVLIILLTCGAVWLQIHGS